MTSDTLLEVRDLETRFVTRQGTVRAVNGVSFSLRGGEVLSLVGESGCGKTVTMLSVLRLLPEHTATTKASAVRFRDRDLLTLTDEEMRRVRGADIGVVFQDPMSSLNPVLTVGRQITETMEVHLNLRKSQARDAAIELLRLVGIPSPTDRIDDYPHQLSGGMCQRAMIAMALSCNPPLLIADEPTTALDVTIQAQILELVTRLRTSRNMAMIWITHDLGVVADLADRVAVMYGGFIVEHAAVDQIFGSPQHPYTVGLLASIPQIDAERPQRLSVIPGQPPSLMAPVDGCPFAERCAHVFDRCLSENPPLMDAGEGRQVACWWNLETNEARAR